MNAKLIVLFCALSSYSFIFTMEESSKKRKNDSIALPQSKRQKASANDTAIIAPLVSDIDASNHPGYPRLNQENSTALKKLVGQLEKLTITLPFTGQVIVVDPNNNNAEGK